MDNISSLQQLQIPVTPANFCSNGTQAEFLNKWVDEILSTSTVTGSPTVTQSQITAINTALQFQQNEIDALTKVQNRGNVLIAVGDNDNTISFATPMPSATYDVFVTFLETGSATTAFSWALKGTPSTTGMVIRTIDIPATITSFDYFVSEQ